MKKSSLILFLMFSGSVFAYMPREMSVTNATSSIYYCPDKVMCSHQNGKFVCAPETTTPQFWSEPYVEDHPPATVYDFDEAAIRKLPSSQSSLKVIECYYRANDQLFRYYDRSWLTLRILSKPEANFVLEHRDYAGLAGRLFPWCAYSGHARYCPFHQKNAVMIHNKNISSGIMASVNGIPVREVPSNNYRNISFNDLFVHGCSAVKQCVVSFSPVGMSDYVYGSVTVDMDKMQILLPIMALHSTEFNVKQVDSLNAVEMSVVN